MADRGVLGITCVAIGLIAGCSAGPGNPTVTASVIPPSAVTPAASPRVTVTVTPTPAVHPTSFPVDDEMAGSAWVGTIIRIASDARLELRAGGEASLSYPGGVDVGRWSVEGDTMLFTPVTEPGYTLRGTIMGNVFRGTFSYDGQPGLGFELTRTA